MHISLTAYLYNLCLFFGCFCVIWLVAPGLFTVASNCTIRTQRTSSCRKCCNCQQTAESRISPEFNNSEDTFRGQPRCKEYIRHRKKYICNTYVSLSDTVLAFLTKIETVSSANCAPRCWCRYLRHFATTEANNIRPDHLSLLTRLLHVHCALCAMNKHVHRLTCSFTFACVLPIGYVFT